MDIMQFRRGLLAQMAGGIDIRPWKIKKIIAPQNYTTLGDIKTWVDGEIPTSNNIWVMKDTIIGTLNYEFIGTLYINDVNTYHLRRMNNGNVSSTGTNNTTSAEYINQGETLTIFYQ